MSQQATLKNDLREEARRVSVMSGWSKRRVRFSRREIEVEVAIPWGETDGGMKESVRIRMPKLFLPTAINGSRTNEST